MNTDYRKVRIPQLAIRSATIQTTADLGQRIIDGYTGYMNRAIWPLTRIIRGQLEDSYREMRTDYSRIHDLAKTELAQPEKAFLLWRTNIPMNLGCGWSYNGDWYLHPADDQTRDTLSELPVIHFTADGAFTHRIGTSNSSWEVLTPCLGIGRFDPWLFAFGSYDPRALVSRQYHWNKNDQSPYAVAEIAANRELTRLATLFVEDRQAYIVSVLRQIYASPASPQWHRYDVRTVITVGTKPEDGVEFYSARNVTPVDMFDFACSETDIESPAVFALVEGGSFSVGLMKNGELFQLGLVAKSRKVVRPPQGMWIAAVEIDPALAEPILKDGATRVEL